MTFRSRATSDQRRRRVLLDENRNEDQRQAVTPPQSARRTKRYADDALGDAQPRITDLVPAGRRPLAILFTLLGLTDAALVALHWFAPQWQQQWPEIPLAVLDANSTSGLAQVAIVTQLSLVTALSGVVFAIRRRRLDDLRGTYQAWVWATVLMGLSVLLASTDLAELLSFGISRIPQVPALATSRFYFWMALAGLYIPLGIRLLIEIRRVRAAQILLGTSALCFATREFLLVQTLALSEELASTLFAAATLLATTLLTAAIFTYARYVKLDASGAFSGRKKLKKRKKLETEEGESAPEESGGGKTRVRVDAASPAVSRPNSIGAAVTAAKSRDTDEETDDDERSSAPLSKAQRKAMRR